MAEESNTVDIVVRCSFQTGGDIHVTCPVTWTIKDMKNHLREACSLHPPTTSQRLIYAGACLGDELTIESILTRRQFEGQPVFHLVCPLPHTSPELRRRGPQTSTTAPANNAAPTSANLPQWNGFVNSSNPTEYAQAYQAYYAWYMSSYAQMLAMYQGGAAGMAFPANMVQGFPQPQMGQNMAPTPAVVNNDAQAAQQAPQANFVQGEVDADERGGDFLDVLYKCFRIMIFMSVVWLYSSIERFLVVFLIGLFIYFMKLRRDQQAAAAAANPPPPPPVVNNNNTGEPNADGDEPAEPEVAAAASGMQLFLSTCYSFVTSFFTSLVPENPVPANLN